MEEGSKVPNCGMMCCLECVFVVHPFAGGQANQHEIDHSWSHTLKCPSEVDERGLRRNLHTNAVAHEHLRLAKDPWILVPSVSSVFVKGLQRGPWRFLFVLRRRAASVAKKTAIDGQPTPIGR